MNRPLMRLCRLGLPGLLLVGLGGGAAGAARAAGLGEVLDQVWSRYAPLVAARQAEGQARQQLAGGALAGWLAAAPSLTVAGRSDAIASPGRRQGAREWELELALPLRLPGQQQREQRLAASLAQAGEQDLALQRWQLAGSLREAWWDERQARLLLEQAHQRELEAQRLLADVQRRVQAGERAPLEAAQAGAAAAQAGSERAAAEAGLQQAQARYQALAAEAPLPERAEEPPPDGAGALDADHGHPQLLALQARSAAARARLEQLQGQRGESPELALGLSRERGSYGEAQQTQARLALKFAIGAARQQAPQEAQARADWLETQQMLSLAQRQLAAEQAGARAQYQAALAQQGLQLQRLALARQGRDWVAKAFDAGQLDLPALLRADSELADARAATALAEAQRGRAISRWRQSLGLF